MRKEFVRYIAPGKKMPALKERFISAVTCAEGSAAIEFALIVPVFVLLIVGMLSFGLVIFESSVLQGALNTAAHQGKTGWPDTSDPGTSASGLRWKNVNTIFTSLTNGLFKSSKLTLTANAYGTFTDAINDITIQKNGQITITCPPSTCTAGSLGDTGAVVVYTATYPYPAIPFIQSLFGKNNTMIAYYLVRNETFPPPPPAR